MTERPFPGVTSAGLLAEVGKKFTDKNDWIKFLEGVFLMAVKDALIVVDEVSDPNISNSAAGIQAAARATALISIIKLKVMTGGPDAVQEQSASEEVPGAGETGQAPQGDDKAVAEGNPKAAPTPRKNHAKKGGKAVTE